MTIIFLSMKLSNKSCLVYDQWHDTLEYSRYAPFISPELSLKQSVEAIKTRTIKNRTKLNSLLTSSVSVSVDHFTFFISFPTFHIMPSSPPTSMLFYISLPSLLLTSSTHSLCATANGRRGAEMWADRWVREKTMNDGCVVGASLFRKVTTSNSEVHASMTSVLQSHL